MEGSLKAPTRHSIEWRASEYGSEEALFKELQRVFDICHGCRRCFSLCNAFPTLFDAVDASPTGELDGVARQAYWQVVDHCYLCDLCYMTKCPYVPPHPWNVDFPHLMLRAKALKHARGGTRVRDRLLSATDAVGRIAGIPVVAETVNAANASRWGRKLLQAALGVHAEAPLPQFAGGSFRRRYKRLRGNGDVPPPPATDEMSEQEEAGAGKGVEARPGAAEPATAGIRGRVALFVTCYANHHEPQLAEDLLAVFEHNGIPVVLAAQERCCGMPKLELGDLAGVEKLKQVNVPALLARVEAGYDIVAPVPSCVLMFKQELPLLFPEDPAVAAVKARIFDPFEYLMHRHRAGLLSTDFKRPLGRIAYHAPCHLRVQNIGLKTRDVLKLIPGTELEVIERCSGHDGTYAVKKEFYATAQRIGRPVVQKVAAAEHLTSDCPMAARQIAHGLADGRQPIHPLTLLRRAYGI